MPDTFGTSALWCNPLHGGSAGWRSITRSADATDGRNQPATYRVWRAWNPWTGCRSSRAVASGGIPRCAIVLPLAGVVPRHRRLCWHPRRLLRRSSLSWPSREWTPVQQCLSGDRTIRSCFRLPWPFSFRPVLDVGDEQFSQHRVCTDRTTRSLRVLSAELLPARREASIAARFNATREPPRESGWNVSAGGSAFLGIPESPR